MRMPDQILDRIDGPVGGLRVGQPIHRLRMAQATEDVLDDGFEFLAMAGANSVAAKARVFVQ